jgi:chondroitin 4-sulfotransferase 11
MLIQNSQTTAAEGRQREMQERYHTYCKQHGKAMRATSGYVYNSRPRGIMVVDRYKLLLCRNAKVGYSNWKRLIISMNSNSSNTFQTDKLHARSMNKYSPELAQAQHYTSAEVQKRLKNYFKVTFVRHPLDRLLSAYEDKLGPRSTTSARYLEENGAAIILNCGNESAASAIRLSREPPSSVTFSEFLCYVSQQDYTTMNWHWKPYWAFCQLCHSSWSYDFIGEYEHISEDANYVLDLLGEKNLRYPTSGYRTDAERRRRFMASYGSVPNATIEAVYKRYKIDFDMFGYKLYPNFWYEN